MHVYTNTKHEIKQNQKAMKSWENIPEHPWILLILRKPKDTWFIVIQKVFFIPWKRWHTKTEARKPDLSFGKTINQLRASSISFLRHVELFWSVKLFIVNKPKKERSFLRCVELLQFVTNKLWTWIYDTNDINIFTREVSRISHHILRLVDANPDTYKYKIKIKIKQQVYYHF